jgi:hypothetical protein
MWTLKVPFQSVRGVSNAGSLRPRSGAATSRDATGLVRPPLRGVRFVMAEA